MSGQNIANEIIDKTGPQFDLNLYYEARLRCIQATDEIINKVSPGMSEKEGQALVKSVFASHGVNKHWHATKFRIGSDTLKNFREPTDTHILTQAGDVCFVDLGPVFHDHEADFGRTFVVSGAEKSVSSISEACHKMVVASEEVFKEVADFWKKNRVSGEALFEYAATRATDCGYELNRKMAGHRLGDFPHSVYSQRESLFGLDRIPAQDLWVLEIHLIDQKLQRGAFYEDILRG